MGPCMLHNPSYDFNDELIPLGATLWVRLAEAWLAHPRPDERVRAPAERRAPRGAATAGSVGASWLSAGHSPSDDVPRPASRARRATSRRATPRRATSSSSPRARAASASRRTSHPLLGRDGETLAMDVARDGPPDAQRCCSSAAPATASKGSAARACRSRCSAMPRGTTRRALPAWPCSTSTRSTPTASPGGGARRTRTSTSTATSTTSAPPLPANDRLRRDRRAARARHAGRPTPEVERRAARASSLRTASARCSRPSPAASTATRTACSTAAATRPGATRRCARCCANTATRCARLGWIDLHTGPRPERPRRAHLRRPRRRRGAARARARGGATT